MLITFLGTSCMQPTKERAHPAVLLTYKGEHILFDCGEGTQRQLKLAGIKPSKISKICITHWHGDHCLGLPGLLQTMAASDYSGTLHLFGPKGSKTFFSKMFDWFEAPEPLNIEVHEYSKGSTMVDTSDYTIEALPMKHGTPCIGYSFMQKDTRRINKAFVKKEGIPEGPLLGKLQSGKSIIYEGKKITVDQATTIVNGKKFVYITDTLPTDNIVKLAKDADILVLESTYHSDLREKAEQYFHLTAKDAGLLANEANVKKLILTHFSQRYKEVQSLEEDARNVFDNTESAEDFMKIKI